MIRRTRSQTRLSETNPTTCAQGDRHDALFFLLQERGHTGPLYLLIVGGKGILTTIWPQMLGLGEGQCQREKALCLAAARQEQALSSLGSSSPQEISSLFSEARK